MPELISQLDKEGSSLQDIASDFSPSNIASVRSNNRWLVTFKYGAQRSAYGALFVTADERTFGRFYEQTGRGRPNRNIERSQFCNTQNFVGRFEWNLPLSGTDGFSTSGNFSSMVKMRSPRANRLDAQSAVSLERTT